jgi:hypothetical protein
MCHGKGKRNFAMLSPRSNRIRGCMVLAALSIVVPARGDVIPIAPFAGALSENFDNLSVSGAQQQLSIMGGLGTVSNLTPGGALKLEFSSSLDGVLVVPHSPPKMLGQLGISAWEFDEPLTRFGSYFANNSRFDNAQVDFYDANGGLIDSVTALVPTGSTRWTWNGWQSTVPIQQIVITGNDTAFLNGFIWFDDVQASPAPEPATLLTLGFSGLIAVLVHARRILRPKHCAAT